MRASATILPEGHHGGHKGVRNQALSVLLCRPDGAWKPFDPFTLGLAPQATRLSSLRDCVLTCAQASSLSRLLLGDFGVSLDRLYFKMGNRDSLCARAARSASKMKSAK